MQSGQLPKMSKPPWINQVKEITFEEAELLTALGVEVYGDFSDDDCRWLGTPSECYSSEEHILQRFVGWEEAGCDCVLFVLKDKDDE